MGTDTSPVAPITVPDSAQPALDLIAQVHNDSRRVIDTELQRLSRRVPTLAPADLDVIDAALDDLSDSLILDRLRNAPHDTAPLLRRLFATTTEDR